MKPEDHEAMKKAWQNKTSGLNYYDFEEGFECGLAHRDAQPAAAINEQMLGALIAAKKMCDEALPKFNWGASFLDANAINLLNSTPGQISAAIAAAEAAKGGV